MSKTYEQGREEVARLCKYFADNRLDFFAAGVKEAHVRQSFIDATDREIDRLVYELYGLTEEEIKIIEKGEVR